MSKVELGYYSPVSTREALKLKKSLRDGGFIVAGGTAAVQLIQKRIVEPRAIISLDRLPLSYVKSRGRGVEIGATLTISKLLESGRLPNALNEAAMSLHGLALKEMATVGGNLFTPAPAGDIATALLSLGAELILQGTRGQRTVPLEKFYKGPMNFNIRQDEILTAIRISRPPMFSAFLKQTPWRFGGPTIASLSVGLDADKKVRRIMVAVGGVTPHPYRAKKAERLLAGKSLTEELIEKAAALLTEDVDIIEDGLASPWYRRELVQVFFKRILYKCLAPRGGEQR